MTHHEPLSDEWIAEMFPVLSAAYELQRMLNHNAATRMCVDELRYTDEEISIQREKLRIAKEKRK